MLVTPESVSLDLSPLFLPMDRNTKTTFLLGHPQMDNSENMPMGNAWPRLAVVSWMVKGGRMPRAVVPSLRQETPLRSTVRRKDTGTL